MIIICVAALAGYGVWYSAIAAKSATVAALQDGIDTKTETINRIAATRATLADIASDEAVVQNYFVPELGVVTFIDALEARGKELKASISVLSVSTSGTSARPTLTLTLSVEGTFDAVMRTLGSIEYAPYSLSLTTLSVMQDDGGTWRADVKLVVGSVPAVRSATTTQATSPTALISSPYAYF
jgi:hypothetical protein